MKWRIVLSAKAIKQIAKAGPVNADRITSFLRERVATLEDPRSSGKALCGPLGGLWRYRVGDWRLICEIKDKAVQILVVEAGHRSEIYD